MGKKKETPWSFQVMAQLHGEGRNQDTSSYSMLILKWCWVSLSIVTLIGSSSRLPGSCASGSRSRLRWGDCLKYAHGPLRISFRLPSGSDSFFRMNKCMSQFWWTLHLCPLQDFGAERFRIPEPLFDPSRIPGSNSPLSMGMAHIVSMSINMCDVDLRPVSLFWLFWSHFTFWSVIKLSLPVYDIVEPVQQCDSDWRKHPPSRLHWSFKSWPVPKNSTCKLSSFVPSLILALFHPPLNIYCYVLIRAWGSRWWVPTEPQKDDLELGLVALSLHPWDLSNRCGYPSWNMKRMGRVKWKRNAHESLFHSFFFCVTVISWSPLND